MTDFQPKYNFYQLTPAIFLLEVEGNCDLAYTFLRVQEFYESVNDNIRGQEFTIEQYKQWYCTQSKDKTFSYGEDWKGFNVPSYMIEKCYQLNKERTKEDMFFLSICDKAKSLAEKNGYENFYLLGVRKGDTNTLDHEIAHGLFTTNPEYKKIMTQSVFDIQPHVIEPLFKDLTAIGYGPNVHVDEAQAYLSTGLRKSQETKSLLELTEKFSKIFKEFLGDWVKPNPLIKGIID